MRQALDGVRRARDRAQDRTGRHLEVSRRDEMCVVPSRETGNSGGLQQARDDR